MLHDGRKGANGCTIHIIIGTVPNLLTGCSTSYKKNLMPLLPAGGRYLFYCLTKSTFTDALSCLTFLSLLIWQYFQKIHRQHTAHVARSPCSSPIGSQCMTMSLEGSQTTCVPLSNEATSSVLCPITAYLLASSL